MPEPKILTMAEALWKLASCIAPCPTKDPDDLTREEDDMILGGPWDYYVETRTWGVVDNSDDAVQFRPFQSTDDALACLYAVDGRWSKTDFHCPERGYGSAVTVKLGQMRMTVEYFNTRAFPAAICHALLGLLEGESVEVQEGRDDA